MIKTRFVTFTVTAVKYVYYSRYDYFQFYLPLWLHFPCLFYLSLFRARMYFDVSPITGLRENIEAFVYV